MLANTQFAEQNPTLSPDDRFVAYETVESGRREIVVRSFPDGEGEWQVSQDGGARPFWSPSGDRLYYQIGRKLMAIDIDTGERFSAGAPRIVLETDPAGIELEHGYAVATEGRFLAVKVGGGDPQRAGIAIVQNWFAEFRE